MNDSTVNIMIDIETLSSRSNAVIMSIGAVVFNMKGEFNPYLHLGVNIQSCIDKGMRVDGSTIEWWFNQQSGNITNLMSLHKLTIDYALLQLSELCSHFNKEELIVWSHGSNFDIVVLENAYYTIWPNADIPWKYKNVRDTRTLFDLADYKYIAKGDHDAFGDAMNQAQAVIEAYQKLMKGGSL